MISAAKRRDERCAAFNAGPLALAFPPAATRMEAHEIGVRLVS